MEKLTIKTQTEGGKVLAAGQRIRRLIRPFWVIRERKIPPHYIIDVMLLLPLNYKEEQL